MTSPLHLSSNPTPHAHRDVCPQRRTQRETTENLGVEIHSGCGSGNRDTRTKEKPVNSPGKSLGGSPAQRQDCCRDVSGALPNTHGQGSPEVQVEQILDLVGDFEPKALADHHMPGGAELLVHCLFDHLCSTLEGRGCQSGAVTGTSQLLHREGEAWR